jgi:ABC-type sugar transport system ATPase subunit
MTMADRVVLLRGGRIEQVGTPEDLYAHPATAFAAAFIGAPPMNLFPRDGVTVGVRPEDMRLAGDEMKTGARGIEAVVESVEYLGADSLVGATAAGQLLQIRVPGRAPVRTGGAVHVAWEKNHEHRFDPHTGGRIP